MDVRCEKCGTEYELDEAKVTEVGVTVKCTSCGNLFKVRRKAGSPPTVGPATGVGLAPAPPADGTQKGMPATRPRPFTQTIPAPGGGVADGNTPVPGGWMVRNPDGQIQRFRELTTLQQWIVERKVSRLCEISRSGDSWRKLGDIAELTSFFHVVDLADANARAAAESQSPRRNTQPFVPPGTVPATANANVIRTDGAPSAMQPKMLTDQVSVAPPPRAQSSTMPPPMPLPPRSPLTTLQGHDQRLNPGATPPPGQAPRSPPQLTPPPIPSAAIAGAPPPLPHQLQATIAPSGPNVSSGRAHGASNDPSGPTGGLKGAPVLEPSWAGSADAVRRTSAKLAEDGAADGPGEVRRPMAPQAAPPPQPPPQQQQTFEAFDADDDLIPEPSSRLPWLLAAMFVMLLGGAAAVYFLVMGKKPASDLAAVAVDAAVVELVADASGPVTAPLVDAQPLAPDAVALLAEGWRHFYDDGDAAFEAAEKAFEKARGPEADRDAEALAGLALVNSAWAQALADDADAARAADPRRAEQLLAESRRRLERAAKYAKDAAARAPTSPDATMAVAIATADVRRLQKAKTAEVDKLLAGALGHPESNYMKGMQRWSAGQPADARKLLEVAAADFRAKKGREHLRARYRLALLALADKRYDVARQEVATMLAASPDHVRASALASRIAAASGAGAGEVAAGGTPDAGVAGGGGAVVVKPPVGGGGGGGAPDPDAEPAGGYDALVAKGNTRAENGDCAGAMKLFERALDVRPGGVEALTGLGYCHLDRKEYARAQASFRAALGISPRYGDAIIGLAEAYRFQGQNPQAVEFYRRYVETNPNGPKAAMARRQISLLAPAETPAETPPDKPVEKPPETPPDKPADVPPTDKLPDKPAEPPGATTP